MPESSGKSVPSRLLRKNDKKKDEKRVHAPLEIL
jgi:hypothetical protein